MHFTDIFIRRPVLACTISLFIIVLGLRAIFELPISQYPKTQNAVVTINTAYYGADAKTVAGFITQPLEAAIAQAQGIDYLSSTSNSGISTIIATLRLNYDANRALTEINTQINTVKNQLPPQAQQPVLTVQVGQTTDAMYLGFYSDVIATNNVTDYLLRVVKPELDSVEGVQTAEILGARQFAMRIWLDNNKMASYGLNATDVTLALARNNILTAAGATKGQMVTIPLTASTDLHTVQDFENITVKQENNQVVKLKDIASVVLGSENYDFNVAFNGIQSVFIGIKIAPDANLLEVTDRIREFFPKIISALPHGLTAEIVYDSTKYIHSSIYEVIKTLAEALLIVTVVIFLFLGNLRAVIIPVIAMPLSMLGTFFLMLILGYSINLLTLLALVLAIGLVVDDAIIVVENVERHLRLGLTSFESALVAARELGTPIIAMTMVLIVVYIPIGFQGGLTGALFTEFAFTLAASVTISGIVALTLSPMMCSKFLVLDTQSNRIALIVEAIFSNLQKLYQRTLHSLLDTWQILVLMAGLLLVLLLIMLKLAGSELAPEEDQGIVLSIVQGSPTATAQQMKIYAKQIVDAAKELPEYAQMFQITGTPKTNSGFGGVIFKPWDERNKSAHELQRLLQETWDRIAGVKIAAFLFPPLPGASGLPVQFVITTTEPFENLNDVVLALSDKIKQSGIFYFFDSDLKFDSPEVNIEIDKTKLTDLGLTSQDVANLLSASLGGGYVNYFSIDGRSYKVIPQTKQVDRLNPNQILNYYIHTPKAGLIKLSTFAKLKQYTVPESIAHFQQLNSVTISGVASVSQQEALAFLQNALKEIAPHGYNADYSGQSRQYIQESSGFIITLLFSIVIVYLTLAALFESFSDPIVILVSVPLALFGAVMFIFLGFSTMNIFTQVGLVTLMGLISKHGILIVEVANELRQQKYDRRSAIEQAALIRFRPILMTTAAMVFGVIPLVLADGAGAAGRYAMGLVIFSGLSIGTLFTLFVVPAMYLLLTKKHK